MSDLRQPSRQITEQALDQALDGLDEAGVIDVARGGERARIDVVQSGPLGVKIRQIQVTREQEVDISAEAQSLPRRLARALHEDIEVVEVDPTLGGADLRSSTADMEDGEFYDIRVRPKTTTLRRQKRQTGGRQQIDWTLTRQALKKLVEKL